MQLLLLWWLLLLLLLLVVIVEVVVVVAVASVSSVFLIAFTESRPSTKQAFRNGTGEETKGRPVLRLKLGRVSSESVASIMVMVAVVV